MRIGKQRYDTSPHGAYKAAGRILVSGSSRYTSKGSKASHPRLKTFAVRSLTSTAGAAVGSAAGRHLGGIQGMQAGMQIGGYAGNVAGRKIARNAGWQTRTRERMLVRAGRSIHHDIFHHTHGQIKAVS